MYIYIYIYISEVGGVSQPLWPPPDREIVSCRVRVRVVRASGRGEAVWAREESSAPLGLWAARFTAPPGRGFLICADFLAGFFAKSVQKVGVGSIFFTLFSGVLKMMKSFLSVCAGVLRLFNMFEVIFVVVWRGFKAL